MMGDTVVKYVRTHSPIVSPGLQLASLTSRLTIDHIIVFGAAHKFSPFF